METHLSTGRLAVTLFPDPSGEAGWRVLGPVAEIPDGGTKAFPAPPGGFIGLFAVRVGDDVHVYVNSCPHIGLSLDWTPGRFLSSDGTRIICANHGAAFTLAEGRCIAGPCLGQSLERVGVRIKDGVALVPETAGL